MRTLYLKRADVKPWNQVRAELNAYFERREQDREALHDRTCHICSKNVTNGLCRKGYWIYPWDHIRKVSLDPVFIHRPLYYCKDFCVFTFNKGITRKQLNAEFARGEAKYFDWTDNQSREYCQREDCMELTCGIEHLGEEYAGFCEYCADDIHKLVQDDGGIPEDFI